MPLVKDIAEYIKKQEKLVRKIYDPNKTYRYQFSKDNNGKHIIELFSNNQLIIKAEYEIGGVYNLTNSVWYWGHTLEYIDRSLVKSSDKIKTVADIVKKEQKTFDKVDADYFYFISTNGNFYTTLKNTNSLIQVAVYLSESYWYIPICYGNEETTYIFSEDKPIEPNTLRIEYLLIKKII